VADEARTAAAAARAVMRRMKVSFDDGRKL